MDDGAAPVAPSYRDQALGFEDSQRFPQRYQADPEAIDEDVLTGQQVALDQVAVEDLPAQFLGDDLGGAPGR